MNENANIVEEQVEEPETEAVAVTETEQADELIEMYEDDTEDSEESDEFSTGAKLALGLGGLAAAGLGFAGWKALKKRKNQQTPPAVIGKEDNLGPAPIPDTVPTAEAYRGRKLTIRERLTGRLYIAPTEVKMMQELQELHEEEENEEP